MWRGKEPGKAVREQPSTNNCTGCGVGSGCHAWGAEGQRQEGHELGVCYLNQASGPPAAGLTCSQGRSLCTSVRKLVYGR